MNKTFEVKAVDESLYSQFMNLKFMEMSGCILTEESKAQLLSWETELKKQHGRIAKRSVRAAIGSEQFLMIEGFAVPESFVKVFRAQGSEDYYLQPQK